MKDLKRSLLASGMSLLLCIGLLVGTTFAWFSSSVTNNNNKITAGTLSMNAYVYSSSDTVVDGGTTVTAGQDKYYFGKTGQNLREDNSASINNTNFKPAKTYTKLYEVTNDGTLGFKFKFDFYNCFDGGLGTAVWFDFVPVNEDGNLSRNLNKKKLSQLETYLDDDNTGKILLKGEKQKYLFIYGTDLTEEEFNTNYGDKNFNFDIEIKAAQQEGEFAKLSKAKVLKEEITSVSDVDELMKYITNGNDVKSKITKSVKLEQLMTLEAGQKVELVIPEGITFDIANQLTCKDGFENLETNDLYEGSSAITVKNGATLKLTGGGVLKSDNFRVIKVENGGTLEIDGVTVKGSNGYAKGVYGIDSNGQLILKNTNVNVSTDNDIKPAKDEKIQPYGSKAYSVFIRGGSAKITDCNIDVVGATNGKDENSAIGIYLMGTNNVTLSGTTVNVAGEGKLYSLYNATENPIDVTKGMTLNGETFGNIKDGVVKEERGNEI